MTDIKQQEITKISKEFFDGFGNMFGTINEASWMVVDPLSGYLNTIGYKNKLGEIPKNDKTPQTMVMTFKCGDRFIPAGENLKAVDACAENWMWV